ncbi:GTPase IMAP family member 4-like [Clupea harengus]|uniref:GTPase IMAP family member 4-like n=1 Tax=Clupea harengus TaxID=7950 RepID=A0A8M1KTH7_CLUHA|nr:GTPase IMAP family member 4-like [Clupea harengus]
MESTDSMKEPTGSPSDVGIMIFGKEWSEKSHVGNVILGSYAFESQAPPNQCVAAEGLVDDKHLTVVLTPNLISSQLKLRHLQRRMKECVSLCGPGPQAYILVAQPQDLTEDDHKRVEMILTSVLDQALERTLVVKFLPEDEDEEEDEDGVGSSVDDYESDALHRLIQNKN